MPIGQALSVFSLGACLFFAFLPVQESAQYHRGRTLIRSHSGKDRYLDGSAVLMASGYQAPVERLVELKNQKRLPR